MKYVLPAAVALSLVAGGLAQAQTANSNTGTTTTTNGVGTGTSATPGSSSGTTGNSARNSANTPGAAATTPHPTSAATGTPGSPNTADTNSGHGANALGTGTVGNPSVNTSIRNGDHNANRNSNNAVNTAPQNNPGAPHPGANSFTEGQARSRIQDKGFKDVKDLKKDEQGIWRGHAMKDGKQTNVALDYQGNVVAQ